MLEARIRRVRLRRLQREMVEQMTTPYVRRCLGNDLRPFHGLSVPEGRAILSVISSSISEVRVILTIVIRMPCSSLTSAGFLKSGERPKYCSVGAVPWMYHCHAPTWFDHDPLCISTKVQQFKSLTYIRQNRPHSQRRQTARSRGPHRLLPRWGGIRAMQETAFCPEYFLPHVMRSNPKIWF